MSTICTFHHYIRKIIFLPIFIVLSTEYASGTKYALITADISTGKGMVYASDSNNTPSSTQWKSDTSSKDGNADGVEWLGWDANVTFYLHAKENEGYSFSGWIKENEPSISLVQNPQAITITATSSNKNQPTTENYHAVFTANTLTINATGLSGDNAIFTVTKTKDENGNSITPVLSYTVSTGSSVTIKYIPAGTYSVAVKPDWLHAHNIASSSSQNVIIPSNNSVSFSFSNKSTKQHTEKSSTFAP